MHKQHSSGWEKYKFESTIKVIHSTLDDTTSIDLVISTKWVTIVTQGTVPVLRWRDAVENSKTWDSNCQH